MKLTYGKGLLLLTAVMALGTGMTSLAAPVNIRFNTGSRSEWSEGIVTPEITVNGRSMEPEWSKSIEDWVPGKRIRATFVVEGEYTRSQCSVSGGKLEGTHASEGETSVEVSYIPLAKLASPERAGWSDTAKTYASWTKVPFAPQYQLRLYEDNQWLKTLTTKSTSIDLREYMQSGRQYFFEVRAITKEKSEEKYLEDGEFTLSGDGVVKELGDTGGQWQMEAGSRRYYTSAGTYAASGWLMIDGFWYYFNEAGSAVAGWQFVDGKWYYMNGEFRMTTGWQQVNSIWYYLNEDGSMATGWLQPEPGKFYFLNTDGSMAVNTVVDGRQVNETGIWVQ